MRVIKFRAWDNENNQMLEVQSLSFEDCFYGGVIQIRTTMYSDYFDIREMPLMQYTGLHDKNGKEDYYTEIKYNYDNKINTIEIVEKRENSDWKHTNEEREIYIYENDYDFGVSKDILCKLYDLIQAGLVMKE